MAARFATPRWYGADSRVEANTITYNGGISTCEKAGDWVRALQFLEGMANSRVETDTITYNAAISACEKGRYLKASWWRVDSCMGS